MATRGGVVNLLDYIYPIGHITESTNADFNPNTIYPWQTWERYGNGRVTVGVNSSDADFKTVNKTGGAKTQELAAAIGASNNDPSKIGYCGTPPIPDASPYTYTAWGTGYYSNQTQINHATKVKVLSTGKDPSTVQPYITVYRWRRTA